MEVRGYDANVNEQVGFNGILGTDVLNKYHPNSHSIISIKIYWSVIQCVYLLIFLIKEVNF